MINEASVTARNISKVVFIRILHYPLLLIFVLIVPRMMGPELYGKYAFMFSLLVILLQFTRFGIEEIFVRFIPEFKTKNEIIKINDLLLNTLIFRTIILILVSIIFSILSFYFTPQGYEKIFFIIIAISLPLRGIAEILYALLFGFNDLEKYASQDLFRRFLNLILIIVLFNYFGFIGTMISILIISLFLLTIAILWTKKYFYLNKFRFNINFLLPYLKFGFVFYITSGFLIIIKASGNNLIEFFTKNSKEIAFFDISNNIYLISAQSMFFLFTALIPIFTQLLLKRREDKINKWSSLILRYTTIISVLIIGSIFLIGPELINFMFGAEYRKVFPNLIILFLGIFPSLIAWSGNIFCIIYKNPKKFLLAKSLSLSGFLAFSILLIPQYASIGASIAILGSATIESIAMYILFRKNMSIILKEDYLKIIFLGFILIPFIFLRSGVAANFSLVLIFAITYLILLFTARLLSITEINEIIKAIKQK